MIFLCPLWTRARVRSKTRVRVRVGSESTEPLVGLLGGALARSITVKPCVLIETCDNFGSSVCGLGTDSLFNKTDGCRFVCCTNVPDLSELSVSPVHSVYNEWP